MTYRHPDFEMFINAIATAFPVGVHFTNYQAADVLQAKCGICDPGTAGSYASQTLRHQQAINADCPEADQLMRDGKRGHWHFEKPAYDPGEDPVGSPEAIAAFDADH